MSFQFRSEPMALCQLILQADAAFNCISELGELGMVQFKDLNENKVSFKRKYVNEVRRCEVMERRLKFLVHEIKKRNISVPDDIKAFIPAANQRAMSEYEIKLEHLEKEVRGVNDNLELLLKNFVNLTQLKHLLKKTQSFFEHVESIHETHSILDPFYPRRPNPNQTPGSDIQLISLDDAPPTAASSESIPGMLYESLMDVTAMTEAGQIAQDRSYSFRLRIVAGVISREKLSFFEKMLFRVSHGNIFLKYSDIESSASNLSNEIEIPKTVFLVFFQGEQLKNKVLKICEGFHADVYPCPDTQSARRLMAMGVMTRLEDLNIVLNQTQEHQSKLLTEAAAEIRALSVSVLKTKAIYHTLDMFSFDSNMKTLVGECWCPIVELDSIHVALRTGTGKSGVSESSAILHRLSSSGGLPTYNKTNKVTGVIQSIIDAYGVSTYMEVNPAAFSIITFPFLFSLMFGDVGHGLLLTLIALQLIIKENSFSPKLIASEAFGMFFKARYMVLMMGIFSIYSGFMYNDLFSKPFKFFGSSWLAPPFTDEFLDGASHMTLDPNETDQFSGDSYPFGMDPVWQLSENKISWLNSFKMKISVIFGILHMLFGIILSLLNHRFFKHHLNVVCEFIPQCIFLLFTFGYLAVLIFHKWIAYDASSSSIAPSLLIGFINMFLNVYPDDPPSVRVTPAKKGLQIFLFLSAMICVPWMLFVKPFILRRRMQRTMRRTGFNNSAVSYQPIRSHDSNGRNYGEDVQLLDSTSDDDDEDVQFNESAYSAQRRSPRRRKNSVVSEEEPDNFGDICINQCIHTIEFCLGCISHTASYLRLWALSLAHAQLSEVLWKMVFHQGLTADHSTPWGAVAIFVVFAPWAFLTVGVLLAMEGLSAFLHTLRLHWIEFMSKFFKGEGHPFQPFTLASVDLPVLDDLLVD